MGSSGFETEHYTLKSLSSTNDHEPMYGQWVKSESMCSLSDADAESSIASDPKKVKRRVRHNVRSTRINSAYTPHNRLSRYKVALNSIIPFRLSNTGSTDLPVDNVGCLSNSSFSWIRRFIISPSAYQALPTRTPDNPRQAPPQDSVLLLPKRPYADSCEVNCRRLLGIYKYEETLNGRKKVSMFKVIWRFTRTRALIAALFHCLAIGLSFLGVVLFGTLTVESMQAVVSSNCQNCTAIANCSNVPPAILGIRFGMNEEVCASGLAADRFSGLSDRLLLSGGLFLSLFAAIIFSSIRNWLNLRTAVRLRTAVLSSIYKRAIKSNVVNYVSAHQIMTMANEESEIIFHIVDSSVQLIGIVFGFVMAFIAGFVLLPISGVVPLLGVLPLLLLLIVTGNIAKAYYRKFLAFGAQKLSTVQKICLYFKNIKSLQLDSVLLSSFVEQMNRQYRALQWSNVYSTKFSGGVTSAILIGGLYLIWCDTNIKTESTEVLILLLIFGHHVQRLMLDFCNSIYYILQATASLDKLKQSYQLSTPDNVRLKPSRDNLAVQINEVEVKWPAANDRDKGFLMYLSNFDVVAGQFIGVTGNTGGGKTTLLHSILRNTEVRSGKILQRGKLAYFPSRSVLMNASLKENILFGEPMDPQRYYFATNIMKLNEDILRAAGVDDIPIPYLELTVEQMERIVLARAIYCHRQVILLDEPLNRFKDRVLAKELFLQMLNAFQQDKKTAIVVTQFDELLQYCDRVFRIEDGAIYREGSYAEILNMPSHVEMTRRCNVESRCCEVDQHLYEGSDPAALYIAKNAKTNRRSRRISAVEEPLESGNEVFNVRTFNVAVRNFSACDYVTLALIHAVNNFLYFGPIFTLIIIVEQGDIRPWLSSICLVVILGTFLVDSIAKIYVARITSNRNRSYQQSLLKELLSCSLTFLQSSSISDVIDLFSDTISVGFQHIDSCINYGLVVVYSLALLVIANFWTAIIGICLVTLAIALVCYLRFSARHLYSHEHLSKRRMFSILTNHLEGRVVMQSFDHIPNFIQEFYNNVEENSTAIYMSKSLKFFAEFWVNFFAFVPGLVGLLLVLLLTPQSELSIHRYVLAIFAYLALVNGLNKFVEGLLSAIIASKKIEVLRSNIEDLQTIQEPVQPASLTRSDIGVSVTFRDIVYRVANRKLLRIPKLNIQAGETVALTGTGTALITPLLCRIIDPNQGTVSLNQIDIARLGTGQLRQQIGVICANPCVGDDITIGRFLNPDGSVPAEQINDVLIEVKLFESVARMQNKVEESIGRLSLKDRQLLCLARCYLRRPSLLIVEQPHPDISEIIATVASKKFAEQTIIVLASHEAQYRTSCERVVNLDAL